jgi:hypothetical protein
MSDAGSANTSVVVPGTDTTIDLGDLKASIAAELASGLATPEGIRKRYGFTLAQWNILRTNPLFRGMLAEAVRSFSGPLQAGARITRKAEVMLEDSLPELFHMIKDDGTPSSERIKAVQTLADLAGRSGKSAAQPDPNAPKQAGFTLNINLDGGKNVVIQGSTNDPSQLRRPTDDQ